MTNKWYYMKGEEKCGPVRSKELRALAEAGELGPTDLVWRDGLSKGTPAGEIEGVFDGTVFALGRLDRMADGLVSEGLATPVQVNSPNPELPPSLAPVKPSWQQPRVLVTVGGTVALAILVMVLIILGDDAGKNSSRRSSSSRPPPSSSPIPQPTVGSGEYIGIPSDLMDFSAAQQEKDNWCWAACIQMVYSAKGIEISQDEIVRASYGTGVDAPGGIKQFMDNLRGWKPSKAGWKSLGFTYVEGAPPLTLLTNSLRNNTPVILALSKPGQTTGHAVVMTAVYIRRGSKGPIPTHYIVRDPHPIYSGSRGKRELTHSEVAYTADWFMIVDSF